MATQGSEHNCGSCSQEMEGCSVKTESGKVERGRLSVGRRLCVQTWRNRKLAGIFIRKISELRK